MSDYKAVDADVIVDNLSNIQDVLVAEDLSDEAERDVGEAFQQITHELNSIKAPIEIRDHDNGFTICVNDE